MDKLRSKAKPTGTQQIDEPAAKETPKQPQTQDKKTTDGKPAKTDEKKSAPKPDTEGVEDIDSEESTEPAEGAEESETEGTPETKTAPEVKGKKTSPWKVVEQYKERTKQLEREVAELRKNGSSSTDTKETTERLTKAETRVKELEGELRLYNAEKYDPEFNDKYHAPYERALARGFKDISEIPVTDKDGNTRAITMDDLLTITTSSLPVAKQLSSQMFGEFANDVMAVRNEIKRLWDSRSAALDDLKKNGSERMRQQQEQAQKSFQEMKLQIDEVWKRADNETITSEKHGKYFQPRESDPEWNQRLAKGAELVENAFNGPNVFDPNLPKEAREKAIRGWSAVKHRAAAFGALRMDNERQAARIADLEKQLEEYKSSEPSTSGGTKKPTGNVDTGYNMDKLFSNLRKRAK